MQKVLTWFRVTVKILWGSYVVKGNGTWVLKEKLKRLKGDLNVLNKEVFGDINKTKKSILN